MFLKDYFGTIFKSIKSLLIGMRKTGYYFTHPKEILQEKVSAAQQKQAPTEKKSGAISNIFYALTTAFSFFPAIGQMIYLVYIRKMHKKPDWYIK